MAFLPVRRVLLLLCIGSAIAQTTSSSSSSSATSSTSASSTATTSSSSEDFTVLTGTKTGAVTEQSVPTGPYESFSSTVTLATTSVPSNSLGSIAANLTASVPTSTSSGTVTFLTGSIQSSSSTASGGNFSTSTTASAPAPSNTQPCNNYPELCDRKYGNITMVGCHNSPFVRPGSAAANQQYGVVDQLNDGVRFLQAQMQWAANDSQPHFCHTSCDIFDAGPISQWLGTVNDWVAAHPYDVVTILIENGNYSTPDFYAPWIVASGITKYVYTPPVVPMSADDWPTLASLILSGQRVLMFMDYMANQTAYPWLMDEFSQMWETPFDPTDQSFPCTVQRPPGISDSDAESRLYLMNHNLNVEVTLLGDSILVPAVSELNTTNNVSGYGSLGLAANNCLGNWGKPPTVLDVDYYNFGGFPGSVFEVAAQMNNLTYNRPCCGLTTSGAAATYAGLLRPFVTMGAAWFVLWLLV